MKSSLQNRPDGSQKERQPQFRDKQLRTVSLNEVIEKCRLDQALNMKEFAVRAGISYSAAREWFSLPGFPAFRGVVFYDDFITWRNSQPVPAGRSSDSLHSNGNNFSNQRELPVISCTSDRAKQILDEAGKGPAVPTIFIGTKSAH